MESIEYTVKAAQIFTLFFILLGPLRVMGPFALATGNMGRSERSALAIKIGIISTVTLLLGGFIGSKLLVSYMVLAGSVIVQPFLDSFKEFPPRQEAASFTIDQAMEKMKAALNGGSAATEKPSTHMPKKAASAGQQVARH